MRSLAALLAFTGLLSASGNISGIWIGQIPGRNGDMQDVAFQLVQEGNVIKGKMYGDYQSTPIAEGRIEGGRIEFLLIAPEQAGNQINQTRLRFSGFLANGVMELTRERQSSTNAGNGGGVQFRGGPKTSFLLKKLI